MRIKNAFARIFNRLLGHDSGYFILRHGQHEIFVDTKINPASIWVKISDIGNEACCQKTTNEIGYNLCCHGIKFKVNVKTEKAIIEWFATA